MFSLNRFKVEAVATQRVLNPLNNFGLIAGLLSLPDLGFEAGGNLQLRAEREFRLQTGAGRRKIYPCKKYRFSLQMAYNQLEFGRTPDTPSVQKTRWGQLQTYLLRLAAEGVGALQGW